MLKSGITALYRRSNVPVVPVSLNSGYFWGRRSFRKKPGCIVAQFQPVLPTDPPEFDRFLSNAIHGGNRELLQEAVEGQERFHEFVEADQKWSRIASVSIISSCRAP